MLLNLHNPYRDRKWVENIVQPPPPCPQVRNMIVIFCLVPEINFLLHSFLQIINPAGSTLYQIRVTLGITSDYLHHKFACNRTGREPVANISRTYREDIMDLDRGRKVKKSMIIITMNNLRRSFQTQIKAFVP
jgi:hypothetical protein